MNSCVTDMQKKNIGQWNGQWQVVRVYEMLHH